MDLDPRYKALPVRDNHLCFGCSPNNPSGLQMKFFADDSTVVSPLVVPQHLCGWSNLIHGGIISTILDEIMSWSAIYLLKKLILTKTMTVEFIRPLQIETPLRAEGKILEEKGPREALVQGRIFNEKGEVCARSRGTFALFTVESIREKGIMDEAQLNELAAMLEATQS